MVSTQTTDITRVIAPSPLVTEVVIIMLLPVVSRCMEAITNLWDNTSTSV